MSRYGEPICGTAHNVASPEMLYVSGSSVDERAERLREADDILSAIETVMAFVLVLFSFAHNPLVCPFRPIWLLE